MYHKTFVMLAVSWQKARRYLGGRLHSQLEPYISQHDLAIIWANFTLDECDSLLDDLLRRVQGKTIVHPESNLLDMLLGRGRPRLPLLAKVRRWPVYEFTALTHEPALQLIVEEEAQLLYPLSQHYRFEYRQEADCAVCGRILLHPRPPMRVKGHPDQEPLWGNTWPKGVDLARTNNYEIVVSQRLKQAWQAALPDIAAEWIPVEAASRPEAYWHVRAQGLAHAPAPPTPYQVVERCPVCDRPTRAAISTVTEPWAFYAEKTLYDEEPALTIARSSLPTADLWEADLYDGHIRYERSDLERFDADPEPFFVQTAEPRWLISQRLYRLLHDINPKGWRCKPVNWI